MCNPFMAEVKVGDDIGRALDRLGAFPAKVARAVARPLAYPVRHGWVHSVTGACGADDESFIAMLEQVEDLIDERGISGEDALRVLAGALPVPAKVSP